MSNGTSTSGFESVLIICSWLHTSVSICQVFVKMFDKENFHKMLNYAFLKIQAQCARNLMWLFVYLFTVSKNERNNFAKTSLREALLKKNFILWFFGLKTYKDNCYVTTLTYFITKKSERSVIADFNKASHGPVILIAETILLRLKWSISQLKPILMSRHFYLHGLVLHTGSKSVRLELLTSIYPSRSLDIVISAFWSEEYVYERRGPSATYFFPHWIQVCVNHLVQKQEYL